jgi:hypothetical protein
LASKKSFSSSGEKDYYQQTLLPTTEIERNDRESWRSWQKTKTVWSVDDGDGNYDGNGVLSENKSGHTEPHHDTTPHQFGHRVVNGVRSLRYGGWLGARPGAGRTKK